MTSTWSGTIWRRPAKYPAVPSTEPLSMTISSQGDLVCRRRDEAHWRLNSSWFQQGTITEARPGTNGAASAGGCNGVGADTESIGETLCDGPSLACWHQGLTFRVSNDAVVRRP